MNSFEQSRNTLFSASKEKRNYEHALAEWQYLGNLFDHGIGCAVCELCGQPSLRYQFEIVNEKNSAILLVGSECVTKFGHIKVYDDYGNQITSKRAKAGVARDKRKLVASAKTRSVINSLVMLAQKDTEFNINSFIGYYQERGAFTPSQLGLLFWRLEKFRVPYHKAHMKLSMRRDREKRQLLQLPEWQLTRIQPCLSVPQKAWLARNGRP